MDPYQSHNNWQTFSFTSDASETIKTPAQLSYGANSPFPEASGSQLETILPTWDR